MVGYYAVEDAWMDFTSEAKEEVIDLGTDVKIMTLKDYMDVEIKGNRTEALLRTIDVLSGETENTVVKLPAWAGNTLREVTCMYEINGKYYIPTPYVVKRNLRDLFGLSGAAVSGNIDRIARDTLMAALFKEKGLVKIVARKERDGVRILEAIKGNEDGGFDAIDVAKLIHEKYGEKAVFETMYEKQKSPEYTFTFRVWFPETEKNGVVLGLVAEDSLIGRNDITFHIAGKIDDTDSVVYFGSKSRNHRCSDKPEILLEEIEQEMDKTFRKSIRTDISFDTVLKNGTSALKTKKKEQFKTILAKNLYDNYIVSAVQAVEELFPKKEYADAFYDSGKSKFLLMIGKTMIAKEEL